MTKVKWLKLLKWFLTAITGGLAAAQTAVQKQITKLEKED